MFTIVVESVAMFIHIENDFDTKMLLPIRIETTDYTEILML
jgi:hypothetical protein